MKTLKIVAIALSVSLLASCASYKQVPYFQDAAQVDTSSMKAQDPKTIKLLPGDKISIMVNCADPQIAAMFNLPYAGRILGQTNITYSGGNQGVSLYSVDENGMVDFPVIGLVQAAGLTRSEFAQSLKQQLRDAGQVDDAVITVEYQNLNVYVMGEVNHPGAYAIDRDEFTILNAISKAGDLTIFGVRNDVKVKRVEDGIERFYTIDLTSAQEVLASPVYYLQQGDVVYVNPNDYRVRQSTVNGNTILSTSFWISIANLAITIIVLLT